MFSEDPQRVVFSGLVAIAAGACLGIAINSTSSAATFSYTAPAVRAPPLASAVQTVKRISLESRKFVPEASRVTEYPTEELAAVTQAEGSIARHLLACTLVPLGAIAGYIFGKKPAQAVIPANMYDTYSILSTAGVEAESEQPQEVIPAKAPVVVEKSYAKIIENIEKKYMKDDKEIPNIQIGDTVVVGVRIREGEKERVQDYTGVVICMRNGGLHKSITVRAVLQGIGVERVFPVHATQVAYIRILKRAKVRRAKLYYLRDRFGKAARLKQRFEKSAKA